MTTDNNVVFFSNVRLSFPSLITPQRSKYEDGNERVSYNASFIVAPNDPKLGQFMQVVNALASAKWGEHAPQVMNLVNMERKRRCFSKGEENVNSKTFKSYDGYEGNIIIAAGRSTLPQIIDPAGAAVAADNTMSQQAELRKMYGGCYVNVALKPWLQDNKHGKAVRCDLVAIQFHKDGAAFGGGMTDASGMFGAVEGAPATQPAPSAMPPAPFPGGAPAMPSFLS